jgi:hypothetical protein
MHRAEPELKVRVRVCDYAGIPVNILAEAEFLTAAIFQTAGVKTIWADGVSTGGLSIQAESHASEPAPDIYLRILTTSTGRQLGFPQNNVGFALGCPSVEVACYANVFYQRVKKLAGQAATPPPRVLACVFAHEIGHLLSGADSHSERGIMRADLDAADFNSRDLLGLLFTPSQAKLIQANVRERAGRKGLAANSGRE